MQKRFSSSTFFRAVALGLLMLSLSFSISTSVRAEAPNSDVIATFPRSILIIRHGEKPPETDKSIDLNERGARRALALHELFEASETRLKPFPKPDFVFATAESKHSRRPIETVQQFVNRTQLPLNSSFADENVTGVANEIFFNKKYEGKVILICWHHGKTPELAKALRATHVPKHWDSESAFDRVWEISFDATGKATFADLPQHLLPGDSKE